MRKPSISFSPLTVGYAVFRDRPARFFPWSESVRANLRKAGIPISHIPYISSMFLWTAIVFIISYIATLVLLPSIFPLLSGFLPPIFTPSLINLLAAILGAAICFTAFLYYPKHAASVRAREIDKNLVYVSNYMAIMASSGTTIEQIFRSLASYGELYGVKYVARNVVRNVELLGKDVVESLDEAAKFSPSPDFSKMLQGFIETMKTGGNLPSYLQTVAGEAIETRRRFLTKLIDQLDLAGEIYISALIALPIIFITMFTIMGFLGGGVLGGLSSEQLMPALIYVLVPFMAIGIITYIDAIMASW